MAGKLHIGMDACSLRGRLTGIGRYTWEICRELDHLMPEAVFSLYSPQPLSLDLPSSRWSVCSGGALWARHGSSYGWLRWFVGRMAARDGVAVFWSPRTLLPARIGSMATVVTAHDLNFRLHPRSMPRITCLAQRLWYARDLRRADAVVANSRGTADRLKSLLGIEADAVVRPGVSVCFYPHTRDQVRMGLKKLDIERPYFLAVGTLEPRKNLSTLIDAWLSLRAEGLMAEHDLLIVGGKGWRDGELARKLRTTKSSGVRALGSVSDEDLALLYTGSMAFVMPSVYEGFGMPLQEARACGARLVASDIPELRESGGEDAIYVSPNVDGIANGLQAALSAPAPVFAPGAQWAEAAAVMVGLFRELAGRVES